MTDKLLGSVEEQRALYTELRVWRCGVLAEAAYFIGTWIDRDQRKYVAQVVARLTLFDGKAEARSTTYLLNCR